LKKILDTALKILKWTGIVIGSLIVILLIVRFTGTAINRITPDGGINEEVYIDVNGQKQWLGIYGEDKNNPVMLYLHGGPGNSTSYADWAIMRKLAKDYTVVSWDQRDCGKTWLKDPKGTPVTSELMRKDLKVVVDYLLEHLNKEKLTFLGMSWGTYYDCDFALAYPEKTECIINLSQCVDEKVSALAVREYYLEKTKNDPEYHALAEKYEPLIFDNMTDKQKQDFESWQNAAPEQRKKMEESNSELKSFLERTKEQTLIVTRLSEKYMFPEEDVFAESDINLAGAVFFNPYYSIGELIGILNYDADKDFNMKQKNFFDEFSLKDKKTYSVPIYVMQGDKDDIGGVAEKYIGSITAPDKDFRYISGGHMSTILQSEKLSEFVHNISEKLKRL